jgi:hypothetical protein
MSPRTDGAGSNLEPRLIELVQSRGSAIAKTSGSKPLGVARLAKTLRCAPLPRGYAPVQAAHGLVRHSSVAVRFRTVTSGFGRARTEPNLPGNWQVFVGLAGQTFPARFVSTRRRSLVRAQHRPFRDCSASWGPSGPTRVAADARSPFIRAAVQAPSKATNIVRGCRFRRCAFV